MIRFEDHPDRCEIVKYAVEPGDALLFDYRILHRSRGKDPIVNPSHTTLQPGDPITDDETFPVVHRAPAEVGAARHLRPSGRKARWIQELSP